MQLFAHACCCFCCLAQCRPPAAAHPAHTPPLPPPAQLVKAESDERLALGAGKPYERHLP